MIQNFEYNKTVYSQDIIPYVDEMLKRLPYHINHIVARSSSGCAIASMMLARSTRPLNFTYVKKKEESSHANSTEVYNKEYAFVDDAIASGTTFFECERYIKEHSSIAHISTIIVIKDYGSLSEARFIHNYSIVKID